MKKIISIPATRLAVDDAILKAKREALRNRLLNSQKTPLSSLKFDTNGNVMGDPNKAKGVVPDTKLADDDAAAARKRKEIRDAILGKKKLSINNLKYDSNGNVMGDPNKAKGIIPDTTLASLKQWYETNPMLLEAEKAAMHKLLPNFTLDKLDDGRLYWYGALNIGVLGDNVWNVMAVYDNNHPVQKMGSSVKVYLVEPDINEIIENLGWRPHHLLIDSNNETYLCTTEAEYVKADVNKAVTSAASVLGWAIKWLTAFELVLTGDLSMEDFNTPGKI